MHECIHTYIQTNKHTYHTHIPYIHTIHTYIHTYITLHHITLHYTTLHYITYIPYPTIPYDTNIRPYIHAYTHIHTYITLHHITLHYTTLHYTTLHYVPYPTIPYDTNIRPCIHACMHPSIHTYTNIHTQYTYIYIYTTYSSKKNFSLNQPCSAVRTPKVCTTTHLAWTSMRMRRTSGAPIPCGLIHDPTLRMGR